MLPTFSKEKMDDLRMYRDLTGQGLREAAYAFDKHGQDLDTALAAWDKLEAHRKALAKLDPCARREDMK